MRPAAALAFATVLAGCTTAGQRAVEPPAAIVPAPQTLAMGDAAESLVRYLARVGAMTPAGVASEAVAQRQEAQHHPSDLARVKAAIALILANHPEDGEILALVDPVMRKDSGGEVGAMASFLHVLAADRRRLRESAAARVREERRAQEALRSRAEAAQERAAQLQQKLDALTELEKSLTERQPSSR